MIKKKFKKAKKKFDSARTRVTLPKPRFFIIQAQNNSDISIHNNFARAKLKVQSGAHFWLFFGISFWHALVYRYNRVDLLRCICIY